MVGLPFANIASVELQERMKYVESLPGAGKDASRELYEVRLLSLEIAPKTRPTLYLTACASCFLLCDVQLLYSLGADY